MNFYQFHIGDYIKHTPHLKPDEDLTYRRLLDMYYDTEQPIPNDIPRVSRRLRMGSDVVESVLNEFFELTDEGYRNFRADNEIASYYAYIEKQKSNGRKGGRPKKQKVTAKQNKEKPTANPSLTQTEPKKSLSMNHEPLPITHISDAAQGGTAVAIATAAPVKTKGVRLAKDWVLPKDWGNWALQKGLPREKVISEAEKFRNYWVAKSGRDAAKLDWYATWQNWVIKAIEQFGDGKTFYEKTNDAKERDADKRLKGLSKATPEQLKQLGLS